MKLNLKKPFQHAKLRWLLCGKGETRGFFLDVIG